jgi:hypothetical protein
MHCISARSIGTVALIAVAGCQLTPTFTTGYQVEHAALRPAPLDATLAVRRFEEQRGPRVYSTSGKMFLTYVPLLPYVTLPFERLDESVRMTSDSIAKSGPGMTRWADQGVAPPFDDYEYTASMARAAAEDLAASGLFRDVQYVGDERGPQRYELSGVLRATPLRNTVSSFGLGMAGVLLWLVPVPIGKTSSEVALDLALTDRDTNTVVWRHSSSGEVSRLYTLYHRQMVYGRGGAFSFNLLPPPADAHVDRHSLFSWHFEALRRVMATVKPDIARALDATP